MLYYKTKASENCTPGICGVLQTYFSLDVGITGHGENGWSTLGPKLFLEPLLPGLQETHNSSQYTTMIPPELSMVEWTWRILG